ncbi:receptor expression-enhancing protein 1 isoform X3 [Danaus plexippus]|uniref:receptor expression-enhancing protein 1 isoform X3 n=1 Tax=Danaus plexippus TaxID=13037 RepID=UPI0013C51197|nr:receptor expression-enhancing protein 1 isoform X3 [Danaus plexippus]
MISSIISRLVILVFGTLYPAYASYKAVRTKNLKEYVKWMMYWIVFALFTCTETFTDVFLSWFPFYYEVKIVIVLWLLSPATKGSSILYRKFVHPALCRREQEIDEYIAKAKDQGYHTVLNLGTKGVNYATTVIMQTAIKGGGGLVQQLRKSYSLSDLSECEPREERAPDEADDVLAEPRLIRRAIKSGFATRRSASESNSRTPIYFPEVDVDVRGPRRVDEPDFSHIKSSEDISSGYSSAENSSCLSRTSSAGARSRRVTRTTITSIKRPQAAEAMLSASATIPRAKKSNKRKPQ